MSAGISSALPIFILVLAARTLTLDQTSAVALTLVVSAYASQLLAALEIESRLPSNERFSAPRWSVVAAFPILGSAVFADPARNWLVLLTIAASIPALEVGRLANLAAMRARNETFASSILVTGALATYLIFDLNPLATAAAMALAALVRLRTGSPIRDTPRRQGYWYIAGETALTGMTQPLVSLAIFGSAGAATVVTFRLVSSILGALSPILAFVRVRLLATDDPGDRVFASLAAVLAVAAILILDATGALGTLIGPRWSTVTLLCLVVGAAWKLATLLTVVPFASLRRAGNFRALIALRAGSTLVYAALAIPLTATIGTATVTFTAFLIGELITWQLYRWQVRQLSAAY